MCEKVYLTVWCAIHSSVKIHEIYTHKKTKLSQKYPLEFDAKDKGHFRIFDAFINQLGDHLKKRDRDITPNS